jgi:hypothetical protein
MSGRNWPRVQVAQSQRQSARKAAGGSPRSKHPASGAVYSPAHETLKKSELVEALAELFADAAEGRLEDKKLAERVNSWIPSNVRETAAIAA